MIGSVFEIFSPLAFLGRFAGSLISIVIGAICLIGARRVGTLVWGIVLLVLGIVAVGIGGTLVVIGALLGLLSLAIKA